VTFARYLLVQLVAYSLDLGSFELLVWSGAAVPVVANLIGKVPAGLFAFVAHRWFTFRAHGSRRMHREAAKYFVLLALNAPLSSLILALLLRTSLPVTFAKIAADVLSVGLTFTLTKYVVFTRRPSAQIDRPPTGDKR